MKRRAEVFLTVILLGAGVIYLQAQQMPSSQGQGTTQQQQAPSAQQPSQQPGQAYPGQQPPQTTQPTQPGTQEPGSQEPGSQASSTQGTQTFTGTIVKSGDKYMLQDDATGKTYDIDHQDIVAQHVGKRVRVNGTLDPTGKMIHIGPASH